jgi:type I restriction enzyme, S subunit
VNAPELRFPEFKEQWVGLSLGEVGLVSMCKRIFSEETTSSGDVPFYKIGTFGRQADSYIPTELFERYKSQYPYPNIGDILISAAGTIGRLVIFDGHPSYFQDSNIVWIANDETKVRNDFLYRCYENTHWTTENTTIARLYNNNLRSLSLAVPSLLEQKKIAAFLGVVDAKIAALRAKVAGLETYKRGLMQALFSQRLRFTKPDGNAFPDWEEKKLGEVFVEIKDRVGDDELQTYSISAGRGFVSQEERFGKDISGQQNERYTALKVGDFSYNKGNSITYKYGCIYENQTGSTIAVPNVFISFRLRNKKMAAPYFGKLFEGHYLDKGLRKLISSGARMNGLLNVNKGSFFKLNIPVPHPDEQQKIAAALSAVDAKIQAVAAQVSHMEKFKKGLLQQMFV